MLLGPAGVPDDAVRKLNHEISAILAQPEVQRQFGMLGLQAVSGPQPDQLPAFLASEAQRVGDLIRQLGLAGSQ